MEDGCEQMEKRMGINIPNAGNQEIVLKFEGIRNSDYL